MFLILFVFVFLLFYYSKKKRFVSSDATSAERLLAKSGSVYKLTNRIEIKAIK